MDKPFIFGVAASGNNFTDREKETKRLLMNLNHGINTILISPRHWGKTSLVKKVSKLASTEELKVIYMDIFLCRTERDFLTLFTTAILKQTSSKLEEWLEYTRQFLSRINPKISMGTDPLNDFSITFEYNRQTEISDDILRLPENIAKEKKLQIVICIDEFQQISEFDNSTTFQKRLRTVWQHMENVSFCLSGSKKYLMNTLFEKKSLPFYKFGDVIYLGTISSDDWITYICERFQATGKEISKELAEEICLLVNNHSSYVQQLSWLVWIHTDKIADQHILEDATEDLLNQNNILFQRETENLSAYQINFLKVLSDGISSGFSSQRIMQQYRLGTSANISRIKTSLLQKELIEIENGNVYLADPVFKLWFKKKIQP